MPGFWLLCLAITRGLKLAATIGAFWSVMAPSQAHAAACDQWTGATSNAWGVSSNWSAGVPTARTPVCISPSAQRTEIDVSGKAAAAAVALGRHTQLVIESGARLHAAGGLRIRGTLTFAAPSALVRTPMARIAPGGSMFGVGAVRGSVVNAGTVFAADGGTGTAFRVSARYRQLSSGVLFSRDEGGRFVQLHAAFASLRGRLDLLIEDALVPGSKYAVVSAASLRGRFAHLPPGYVMRYAHGVATAVVTPVIKLGRFHVGQGKRVAVFGASFGDLGIVRFHLDGRNGPLLGSAYVNSVGGFEGFAHIPPSTSLGRHVLVAIKPHFGYVAKAALKVGSGSPKPTRRCSDAGVSPTHRVRACSARRSRASRTSWSQPGLVERLR